MTVSPYPGVTVSPCITSSIHRLFIVGIDGNLALLYGGPTRHQNFNSALPLAQLEAWVNRSDLGQRRLGLSPEVSRISVLAAHVAMQLRPGFKSWPAAMLCTERFVGQPGV